ncbi:ABC transporter substrate-binding protein [Glaciibacter psychrotolerans]|uniref:Branched-chain amino acid transport system substrate-binding protein n=1 Tax=Glaciibacter psychrotolerans TaxID=670054 RepID=A0A7Z0EG87_9MICO|nr:ABC transporter substrate-binding protein [Leifsonia psychrotolerans]NYJ20357.1 branched-chain amino acid transport system substrate-binding protein [Leifsonia psychrotolerans]
MKKLIYTATALAAASVLILSGCSGDSAGGTADAIVVGSVNALSGPATFPEASAAAKSVFDRVNKEGGINGRMIEYKVLDDKADPATASAAAREVVESDNAVALVGSASLLDCEVNAAYYEQQGILSIQGTGVDQVCFDSPAVSPVNVGPFLDTQMTLTYGSEVLGLKKICALLEIVGSTGPAYAEAIENWTAATGQKMHYTDDSVPYGGSDYTPYIVKAKQAGCDAVYSNAVEPDAIGQLKAAEAQGWDDVTFLYLTSTYSESFAKAAGATGAGVYVPAEFAPYTNADTEANTDWRALMEANKIPLTSFGQGGYLAATYFVEVLKGITGDITRESVNEALHTMAPIENPMVGTPYVFGTADRHNSSRGGWPITLTSGTGAWELAAKEWIIIPE